VKTYLLAQGLWDVVEAKTKAGKAWNKRNAAALHAIQISCSSDTFNLIKEKSEAEEAWDTLAKEFSDSSSETESDSSSETESENLINNDPARNENNDEHTQEYNRFFNNVGKGNWTATQEFIRLHPEAVRITSPTFNQTALHVAVTFGHLHIVEKLVNLMTPKDLARKENEHNETAFQIAIKTGNISMAKCMVGKNQNLLSIACSDNIIPIVNAVISGQKPMARYLYPLTVQQGVLFSHNGRHGAYLMIQCINNKMFDIVFKLIELERGPLLLISKSPKKSSPMIELAYHSALFSSGCELKFWQQWIYKSMHAQFPHATNDVHLNIQNVEKNASNNRDVTIRFVCSVLLQWIASNFLKLLGINHIYESKLDHIQSIELLDRMCKVIETLDENQIEDAGIRNALEEAASRGIIEYVTKITKAIPKTMWNANFAFCIFEAAIKNRQAKVFSLIHGLGDKQAIANLWNSNHDTLLHVTGYIANSRKLNLIAGVALQMQREMQWYKEVEAITPEGCQMYTNKYDKMPREVFTDNHKDLMIAGETWMKNTSSSCTVVGALIFTIMFTAAFTLPRGNMQDTGFPMFLDKKLFKLFIISDAISLFSSTTSVLTFLGILTSRYAEEDFLTSLPKKMVLGLSTLFISIAAMMTAFCAVIALLFQSQLWIVVPTILLASIPVILFVGLQFPLLVEIFVSTYGRSIFDRNVGNSLA
ncbi:hypothetical protein UlMin_025007, partial [Ulmus minor]